MIACRRPHPQILRDRAGVTAMEYAVIAAALVAAAALSADSIAGAVGNLLTTVLAALP